MQIPTLAFLPSDVMRWALLPPLAQTLQEFQWAQPALEDYQQAISGSGEGSNWLARLVESSDLVVLAFCSQTTQPRSWEMAIQALLDRRKPALLLLLGVESDRLPAGLSGFPVCDLTAFLAHREQLFGAGAGRRTIEEMLQLSNEFYQVREAVLEVWEAALPPEVRSAIAESLQRASGEGAASNAEELLVRLSAAGDAFVLADQHRALRLREMAREVALGHHNALVDLSQQSGELSPGLFERDVFERWQEACARCGLSQVVIRLRLSRIAGTLETLPLEHSVAALEEMWSDLAQNSEHLKEIEELYSQVLDLFVRRALRELEQGRADEASAALERIVALTFRMGDERRRIQFLGLLAQAHLRRAGGALRAVRAIESALELNGTEYAMGQRDYVLAVAKHVRETLDRDIESALDEGRRQDAWNLLRLLVRLSRALPDQSQLAESLACQAYVGSRTDGESALAAQAAQEARHLERVYGLAHLEDLLGTLHDTAH